LESRHNWDNNAFDQRRDVDTVAKDIITLNNDIADVDLDPKPQRIASVLAAVDIRHCYSRF
jgi:hypothetical protein